MSEKYTINDRRGREMERVVCRCCGSSDHTGSYNQPSMKCIEYLRAVIADLQEKAAAIAQQKGEI